jgi:hypothetical protein
MSGFEKRAFHPWLAWAPLRHIRTAIGSRVNPTHTQAASALERNPAGPPGPTVNQSQKAGQFFAYAKWRKIGKYPANQNGLLLKAKADRLRFVQRT